ncbi:M20 family metallopeptidase [Anaerosinus massiliensis]|uniref:M20 family metallopeptidase n=1 Tax=Massilibacillus massiliensis TaxID=1806837 RepID=UPI000DA61E70|nr:M20 family metallopeptidase [Massilibacillus massiliensis]
MGYDKRKAFDFIDTKQNEMIQLWKDLVNLECGALNKPGVDIVGKKLAILFEELGCNIRFVEFEKSGNMLIAEYGDTTKEPYIIFTGHMDTVFADGTAAQRPFAIKDGRAYGPGVLDMKGGIVILLYALKALHEIGYKTLPIKIVLLGDEENGHLFSNAGEYIVQESKGAIAAFNFETGFMDDGIVIARKGMFQFCLEVFGIAAHVGNDPENGRSAILEIAHKIIDIEKLTDFEKGNTFNVGVIEGGTVANATPDYAKITVDLRFLDPAHLPEALAQIEKIVNRTYIAGTTTTFSKKVELTAMKKTNTSLQLFEIVKQAAEDENLGTPYPKTVGGASDSAYTVLAGVPTVCAMGVKGGRNHSKDEFAVIDTLFERAKLTVATILKLKSIES